MAKERLTDVNREVGCHVALKNCTIGAPLPTRDFLYQHKAGDEGIAPQANMSLKLLQLLLTFFVSPHLPRPLLPYIYIQLIYQRILHEAHPLAVCFFVAQNPQNIRGRA